MRNTPKSTLPDTGSSGGLARAATFPTPTTVQNGNPTKRSSDESRYQGNKLSNPNLRQSYHELISPTELSASGTPDSSSTGNSIQQQKYNMQQQVSINNALPDLSAMMFPSADPFAYPNQPLMEFDNIKQESVGSMPQPNYPSSNGAQPGMYDDLEGQLFNPIHPYLIHGQPNFDLPGQMVPGFSGLNPQEMIFQTGTGAGTGVMQNGEMSFDGLFSGDGDEWSSMLADQRFRQ